MEDDGASAGAEPPLVVSDNGAELTSRGELERTNGPGIERHYLTLGKPTQNVFVDSFNGRFRDGCPQ